MFQVTLSRPVHRRIYCKYAKHYLDLLSLLVINNEQNKDLGHRIAEMEILKVIHKGKAGRSPGSDGVTYEFY